MLPLQHLSEFCCRRGKNGGDRQSNNQVKDYHESLMKREMDLRDLGYS